MSQFSKEETDKLMKIRCPMILDGSVAKDFSEEAKNWVQSALSHFVLDLTGVANVHRDFYQAVIRFKTALKQAQKTLYSINVSASIQNQFKQDGVESAFNPIKSLEEILAKKPSKPGGAPNLNVHFINPFLAATQKTLEVQCKTSAKVLKPYLKQSELPDIAIASVLALNSDGFSGSVVLCFPQETFLKIYENMFGEKHTEINAETRDAAAEFLNIIYGMAKIDLNLKGYNFQKALPTVLVGDKLSVRHSGPKPAVVIPFETAAGTFHMEIEFEKAHES